MATGQPQGSAGTKTLQAVAGLCRLRLWMPSCCRICTVSGYNARSGRALTSLQPSCQRDVAGRSDDATLLLMQVESHPYFRNDALRRWCTSEGVHVTAYSPLGSPDSAAMFKRSTRALLEEPAVLEVAARLGKTAGQVCELASILLWLDAFRMSLSQSAPAAATSCGYAALNLQLPFGRQHRARTYVEVVTALARLCDLGLE